jgi:hypothetical protein
MIAGKTQNRGGALEEHGPPRIEPNARLRSLLVPDTGYRLETLRWTRREALRQIRHRNLLGDGQYCADIVKSQVPFERIQLFDDLVCARNSEIISQSGYLVPSLDESTVRKMKNDTDR